jgi:hypothetical protein
MMPQVNQAGVPVHIIPDKLTSPVYIDQGQLPGHARLGCHALYLLYVRD